MEIQNEILNNLNLEKEQNNFINSTIGKVVNNAIDIGLRYVLPDLIEEEVIEVKDSLIQNGLKEGIQTAIDSAMNIGKSAIGIVTGNFENISQIKKAVDQGGLIDSLSEVIDFATTKAQKIGIIDKNVGKIIKSGKNSILNNVSSSIEKEFINQEKNIEKLEKYSKNWKEYYTEENFDGMEKEYNKMREKLNEIIPIETTIKEARKIEMIHNLIKNNGKNFNLSNHELELVKKLN